MTLAAKSALAMVAKVSYVTALLSCVSVLLAVARVPAACCLHRNSLLPLPAACEVNGAELQSLARVASCLSTCEKILAKFVCVQFFLRAELEQAKNNTAPLPMHCTCKSACLSLFNLF
jgi:hypothetical protein